MKNINLRELIKPKFESHYKELLGNRYEEFIDISLTLPVRSIRVNTIKISVKKLIERIPKEWELKQIPWCETGFWIENKERKDVGNLIEHALGYFYVQDAASMIPPIVLDPKPNEKVLDMCASPGSKSSQIAQMMENSGTLIANDNKGIRLAPLGINLQRMGISNTIITLMSGTSFRNFEFDKILVDAPCSCTGTIRKSLKVLTEWSENMIQRMVKDQKKLLEAAYLNLKKGGTLVYSTCSVEPEEDEGVITWFLDKYKDAKLEKIEVKGLKCSEPVLSFKDKTYNPEVKKCLRIYPQDNDTEGFFVAKIIKG